MAGRCGPGVLAAFVVVAAIAPVGFAAKPAPPRIAKHGDVKAEATGRGGATVRYTPARVSGAKSVAYSKPSGSVFPLGKTTVTITARSGSLVARSSFVVEVVDTTAPVLAAMPDLTGKAGVPLAFGPVTATDLVDPDPQVACVPASGSVFPPGRTYVSCVARDASGNSSSKGFWVTIPANAPPRFPSSVSVQADDRFQYDSLGRLQGVTTTVTISAAIDPDGDPVSYGWTATNGSIVGNGTSATWSRLLIGGRVQRGSVTVTASDDKGGTDTFTINFN